MAETAWMVLTADGGVDVYPSGWHVAADGAVSKAPIDLEMRPHTLADGSTVAIVGNELVITPPGGTVRCRQSVGTSRVGAVAAGGNHAAVAVGDIVLVVDGRSCAPVSIVAAESVRGVALDDTRMALLDGANRVIRVDWRTWIPTLTTPLASVCTGLKVGPEGPSMSCGGRRVRLPDGAPVEEPPAEPTPSGVVLERGLSGWGLYSVASGERLSPAFGGARPHAVMDDAHRLAVEYDAPAKPGGPPRTLAAFRVADGAPLWSVQTESDRGVQVLPGAVIVSGSEGVTRFHDRADGHPIWTLRVEGPGLAGLRFDLGDVSCLGGEPGCPPWTGHVPALPEPPVVSPKVAPPTRPPGRAAAARDKVEAAQGAVPPAVDRSTPPGLELGSAPFEGCGTTISVFNGNDVAVPIRNTEPTLVLAGVEDDYDAADGVDVLVVDVDEPPLVSLNNGGPFRDGSRHLVAEPGLGDDEPPFGLRTGHGVLVSGDCKELARGPASDVIDATLRWAYRRVDRPLPTTVAKQVWSVVLPGRVSGIAPLPGGGVAWWGSKQAGAIDQDGVALWRHEGIERPLLGDGERLFEEGAGEVHELDPRTGAVRRVVPGATALRVLDDGLLLVDLEAREQVVLDAATLEPKLRLSGARYATRLHDGVVTLRWPAVGNALVECKRQIAGAVTCGPPAPVPVPLGGLSLIVEDDVLTARTTSGKPKWTIHGVKRVQPGPGNKAIVQLGSVGGRFALVDRAGRLTAWLPADRTADASGYGVAGDRTLTRWEP